MEGLVIKDLKVSGGDKEILNGINLSIKKGEVHAVMGPNGSGKSTLAFSIFGHPSYRLNSGTVLFNCEDISSLKPDERSRKGLFLAFQNPVAVSGVTVSHFLWNAYKARFNGTSLPLKGFKKLIKDKMAGLHIDESFAKRYLNDDFSGGEKKKVEILQMEILKPEIAILDETDSGLDIDALKVVSEGIKRVIAEGAGMLLITHYIRLLNYVRPEFVHILLDGKIVKTGSYALAKKLEKSGYEAFR